jgi:hypothetical protein
MVPVDSVSVEAIGYNEASQELFVRFVSGKTYRYSGVPADVAAAFLSAPSKGSYFNREIRPVYRFVRV